MSFGRTKTGFNKAIKTEMDKGNGEIVGWDIFPPLIFLRGRQWYHFAPPRPPLQT